RERRVARFGRLERGEYVDSRVREFLELLQHLLGAPAAPRGDRPFVLQLDLVESRQRGTVCRDQAIEDASHVRQDALDGPAPAPARPIPFLCAEARTKFSDGLRF